MLICRSCIRPHVRRILAGSIRNGPRIPTTARRGIAVDHDVGQYEDDRPRRLGYAEAQELEWSKARGGSQELVARQSRDRTPVMESTRNDVPKTSRKAMKKHLEFLEDPLKLANDVLRILQADKLEEALELVRYASKSMPCVVSWNHLVDWQMRNGKIRGAVKTYNEMKKRAQRPDGYTYTILFRGLAAHAHSGSSLEKALAIWQSLTSPKSEVVPNRIHTNSILKVCARAGAMDALFGIAAKIPTRGPQAADNLTFTTILNALREYAIGGTAGRLSDEERQRLKTKTIIDGRRIWEDVIGRWRAGELRVDEQLTCAMGRLLLISESEKDWDDVFSLLQQTMNIPRPFPALGTPERDVHEPSSQSKTSLPSDSGTDINEEHLATSEPSDAENTTVSQDEFRVVNPPLLGSRGYTGNEGAGGYVRPGTNTLSIAMEAMLKSSMKGQAGSYWNLFVQDYQVRPDRSNYAGLLRVLRQRRASSDCLEVLMYMDPDQFEVKHFKLAMTACSRDKINPNAFANAGKILDLMQQNIALPDIGVLCSYLDVAMAGSTGYAYKKREQLSPREIEEKTSIGRRIQRALFRLQPQIVNLRSILDYGSNKLQSDGVMKAQFYSEAAPDSSYAKDAVELFTRIVSAYDRLLYGGMSAREDREKLQEQKNLLNAVVVRIQHKYRLTRTNSKNEPARTQVEAPPSDEGNDQESNQRNDEKDLKADEDNRQESNQYNNEKDQEAAHCAEEAKPKAKPKAQKGRKLKRLFQ